MKICSVCNRENANVKGDFCVFCGGQLIEKNETVEIEIKKEDKVINKSNESPKQREINKNLKIAIIILVTMLVSVSGIAIYFKISDNTSELKDEIATLKKQISTLKDEKSKLSSENASLKSTNSINSKKIDFFDKHVVFVIDGYGRYYYTYNQMEEVTQGKSFTYWAYNLEQAIDLGIELGNRIKVALFLPLFYW